ncbi:GntR family transcriptional regulator [Aureimonas populi]|uniref:GntR family transcriptional regulator n=1 Tax=Aureimonas populi TaxID=1701758 RepID=A0ABW5CQH4_9HYPH|nr:GntR family transcriptional regulator [Aureimonas populi]
MLDLKVERQAAPLRHGVTDSIRNAIALGHFRPGERMPERVLCEITGVSRTLVREALRQLESEGLVQVVPHRGPVVAKLSVKEAQDIYRVRAELEGLASELFAEAADDAAQARLREAFATLKAASVGASSLDRLRAKNAFYESLLTGSGNSALGTSLHFLNSRIMLLRAMSLQAPGRVEESIRELGALVEALVARDAAKARTLAVAHVGNAAKVALDALAKG